MQTSGFVLLTLVTFVCAWPDLYDNEFKRWSLTRRSMDCKSSGGTCYSTNDCCHKYVCAEFDDFGSSPIMPGWCVHEKELQPCVSSIDCESGTKCRALDGQRYCVPSRKSKSSQAGPEFPKLNGRGRSCESDNDCAAYDKDGKTKLCCQQIRRGRQGVVKKCDPITPISVCLTSRK